MFDIKSYEDDEQMEYLRQQNIKKIEKIKRRKERYRVLLEKMRYFFKNKTR